MNRQTLYSIYGKLERLIAPKLRYSQYLYEEAIRTSLEAGAFWLDLGCGHQVLPPWRASQEKQLVGNAGLVVGFDYDMPSLRKHRSIRNRVRGDIGFLPFPDKSFDLVTANMVIEHIAKPQIQLGEVCRVLRPGGLFVFHTPNAWGYSTILARLLPEFLKGRLAQLLDDRPPEDVFKTFYLANTERRIRHLADQTGFQVEQVRLIASSAKFAVIAPLAFFELFWIRLLMTRALRAFRTNLIVTLVKNSTETPTITP
jgi:ubiquinone/menaquinone biosynthesis C-methylase UbiE